MRAQMQAEFESSHFPAQRWPKWLSGNPETPGHYLVRVENDERTWVRLEYFDGGGWPLTGGYATVTGYLPLPPV
jgi:hypothetical protein